MSRLLLLAATILGLLGALELLCRLEPEGLAAVAHRVRFKLALLHAKGEVDFVALGTSRSNDGLNPALLLLRGDAVLFAAHAGVPGGEPRQAEADLRRALAPAERARRDGRRHHAAARLVRRRSRR